MSASSRSVCIFRKISKFPFSRLHNPCHNIYKCQSTVTLSNEYNEEAEYPPIKPKYPPGQWGKLDPKIAWKWYEKGQNMLSLADPRERLESFAGQDDIALRHLRLFDYPKSTNYKRAVTKTCTVKGLPDMFQTKNVEVELLALKPLLLDSLAQPNMDYSNKRKSQFPILTSSSHRTVGNMLMTLMTCLSSEHSYLRRAQVDENVQVASFWYRDGDFAGKYVKNKPTYDWFLKFEGRHEADFQIRTENPLSEVSMAPISFYILIKFDIFNIKINIKPEQYLTIAMCKLVNYK